MRRPPYPFCVVVLGSWLVALAAGCADPHAPVVEVAPLGDTRDSLGPYTVTARVVESRGIAEVRLYHRDADADRASVVPMTEILPGRFEGEIPGRPSGTRVHWFVEAEDRSGNLGFEPPEAELGDRHCRALVAPGDPVPDGGVAHCFTVLHD